MVSIRKIDGENVRKILRLEVDEGQKDFVATNTESIVEAYLTLAAGAVALPFAIYDSETPVGFLMIGYDTVPGEEHPPIAAGNYCIWRLMIDRQYQGRGFGSQALRLALEYVRSFPCGEARFCYLSYEPENTAAAKLYHDFGFRENGETDGDEVVAVLPL